MPGKDEGDNDRPAEPLNERHYVLEGSTQNLSGVAIEVQQEVYDRMVRTIDMLGQAQHRLLGRVDDRGPAYYTFEGSNVYLRHGLAQEGGAITTDNPDGFPMIRLFANSIDEMGRLEIECGRDVECPGQHKISFGPDKE